MANSKIVKSWFNYAARDLKVAIQTLHLGSEYKNISAFHSQQSVEKVTKGMLAHYKVRFPKTHDLDKLAQELLPVDKSIASLVLKSKELTEYAVIYRYPDAERKPLSLSKAKDAIKKAQKIYDACFKVVYGKSTKLRS